MQKYILRRKGGVGKKKSDDFATAKTTILR